MEIHLDKLREKSLFIATPFYGGNATAAYTKSLFNLGQICAQHGIRLHDPYFLSNESLIPRARNYCVAEFLRSDCTHFMFIDSDLGFNPYDVLALLHWCDEETDKDIVCGTYPKKNISWEKIARAVEKGLGEKNPNDLAKYMGDYVIGFSEANKEYKLNELIPVNEAGTGFMMIKRSVFPKFAAAYPELSYAPDHKRTEHFDGSTNITAFFLDLLDNGRHLSEDYMFCHWARRIGMKVWVAPWMNMDHYGTFPFVGNFAAIAEAGVSATLDQKDLKKAPVVAQVKHGKKKK